MTTKKPEISARIDVDDPNPYLEFTFADEREPIVVSLRNLSNDMLTYAALHGLKQKIGDAAAISRDPETGRSATLDDKRAAMRVVADRIALGEWNAARGEANTGGLLLRALIEYTGKDRATIAEFLAKKSRAEQAALRANPKIAVIIDRMRESAAKESGIDTDTILKSLTDD